MQNTNEQIEQIKNNLTEIKNNGRKLAAAVSQMPKNRKISIESAANSPLNQFAEILQETVLFESMSLIEFEG